MPGKKKKPTKSESESEASEKEESEEEEDEGSEEEEDEDKGSDEEEDEDEEDEDNEESEENSEKSDKSGESDDEDKSSKSSSSSSKSSKSGSSDGSKSDSDESDGSGKKAKKKKKKDKKDKEKAKKGKKGKEEPVVESKKSSSKNELPPEPPKLTIASVFQDLDDLSNHLAKTFTTFNEENKAKEVQKQSSPSASPDRKNDSPLSFPNQRPPIHSATLPGGYGSKTQLKPLVDDTGVQCDPEPAEKRQASPEAIRAVQEYKQRKEQERKRKESPSPSPSPEEPKAVKNGSQVSQGKHRDNSQPRKERDQEEYERVRREERKREQDNTIDFKRRTISPKRTGPNWTRANQIAEDYYSGLYKKSAKNPVSISGQKTVHDLYKYKPKPAFVEDDSQPIVQYDEGDFRRTRDQPTFDVYDPRLKPQNEYSYKYNPLNSNKKPINDAMDVLARKSRNNQKF